MQALLNRIANPAVRLLLRSPFHRLFGGALMLITVTGRRSGRRYTTPVQAAAPDPDTLYATTRRSRTWYRNLREPAPVEVVYRGRRRSGTGRVLAGDGLIAHSAIAGTAIGKAVERAGLEAVIVRIDLEAAPAR